jgi:hypothetical protein
MVHLAQTLEAADLDLLALELGRFEPGAVALPPPLPPTPGSRGRA